MGSKNAIIEGLAAKNYAGFSADIYEWAITDDDNIAFLFGDSWRDLILMKSSDGGNTWSKTVIWEHPYPLFNTATLMKRILSIAPTERTTLPMTVKDLFMWYSASTGQGAMRELTLNWYPFVDGVGYWNENRPTFSNHKNALSPYGDPGSELEENYSLIGWTQDVDGSGTLEILEEVGTYFVGLSSQPQIVITEQDQLLVVYSSVTENYDNRSRTTVIYGQGTVLTENYGVSLSTLTPI